jgi:hypothetical protein
MSNHQLPASRPNLLQNERHVQLERMYRLTLKVRENARFSELITTGSRVNLTKISFFDDQHRVLFLVPIHQWPGHQRSILSPPR